MMISDSYVIIIFLSAILLTVASPAFADEIKFDQNTSMGAGVIITGHSDNITYVGGNPSTVTLTGSSKFAPTDLGFAFEVPIFQVPDALLPAGAPPTYRVMVQFTNNCTDNDLSSLTYCVNDNDTITVAANGISNSIKVQPKTVGTQQYLNKRTTIADVNCTPNPDGTENTDQDFVCDAWEKGGRIEIPYGGSTYTYACDSGCTNSTKDLFVEIDYMEGHKPNQESLGAVKQAFADKGIILHLQVDDKDSPRIFHSDFTRFPGANIRVLNGFDQLKTVFFGTNSERMNGGTVDPSTWWTSSGWIAKKAIFHYALFTHAQLTGSSGIAEELGNDMMISLGTFDGQIGNPDQQAGTFMHELGHNLNLNHGGSWSDGVNCKPQYLSIMSYSRQFSDLVSDRSLDYSHQNLGTVNETTCNEESTGVQSYTAHPHERMVWGPSTTVDVSSLHYAETGPNIDWDGDPTTTCSTADLNDIGSMCPSSTENYEGFDDWANIDLNMKNNAGSYQDGRVITTPTGQRMLQVDEFCLPVDAILHGQPASVVAEQLNTHRYCGGGLGEDITSIQYVNPVPAISTNQSLNASPYSASNLKTGEYDKILSANSPELSSKVVKDNRVLRVVTLQKSVATNNNVISPDDFKIIMQNLNDAKGSISKDQTYSALLTLQQLDFSNYVTDKTIAAQLNDEKRDVESSIGNAVPEFGSLSFLVLACTVGLVLYLGRTKLSWMNSLSKPSI